MALGYPCFRLRGHYFVIATIVIAEIALLLFQNWDWAGAAHGHRYSRAPATAGSPFSSPAASCPISISRWRWPASPGS
jgi:ABC-type branched-subunit amino acid transport system permease subunit